MTSCHVENFYWPTLIFDFSVAVIVLFFLAVPLAGLWFVIVVFPGQTHSFTLNYLKTMWISRKSNLANVN